MNAKNLIILTVITLIVVVAAMLLTQPPKETVTTEKQLVFPNLMAALNDVAQIQMATKDEKFTLQRQGNQWLLKEKHNYPVALEKVRNVLYGLAELATLEAKTADPARYAKIGVEELAEKEAKSTLVTLKKSNDEVLANLLVGNSRPAKIDSTRQEIYLRKPGEKQAWLALGSLPLEKKATEWLDKQIFDVDSKRVRQVTVTQADGHSFKIFKATAKDDNYQLADMPKGATLKASPYDLNQIANVLSNLTFNDIKLEKEFEFKKEASHTAILTTFDGLEVTLTTTSKEGKYYAKFAAALGPVPEPLKAESPKEDNKKDDKKPATEDKEKPKTVAEVKKEIEALKSKIGGWVFEIPQYKFNVLLKKREDLLEEKPKDNNKKPLTKEEQNAKLKKVFEELGEPKTAK